MPSCVRYLALPLVLLGTACGCGIVHYRETKFTVQDEVTNAPVPKAIVVADMMPVMGMWNCQKVPLHQYGSTDQQGVWKVTLPTKRAGFIIVESDGYERKVVNIEEHTLDGGQLEVKLAPAVKGTSEQQIHAADRTETGSRQYRAE